MSYEYQATIEVIGGEHPSTMEDDGWEYHGSYIREGKRWVCWRRVVGLILALVSCAPSFSSDEAPRARYDEAGSPPVLPHAEGGSGLGGESFAGSPTVALDGGEGGEGGEESAPPIDAGEDVDVPTDPCGGTCPPEASCESSAEVGHFACVCSGCFNGVGQCVEKSGPSCAVGSCKRVCS